MSVPSPTDIRKFLEGYGIDTKIQIATTGDVTNGSPVIVNIDTRQFKDQERIYGIGIPQMAIVQSIDIDDINGQITMDVPATADGTAVPLLIDDYPCMSTRWILDKRDNFVIPFIEEKCNKSFRGIRQVTEYYSGTGSPLLILRNRPIIELITIGYTNVDTNFYFLAPTALVTIAEEGILKAKANFNESSYIPIFFKGERNILVTYSYGYADMPDDVGHAVKAYVSEQILGHIGSKTGGGDTSMQAFSRGFGVRGKWTHIRNDFARIGHGVLRKYMTGITSV